MARGFVAVLLFGLLGAGTYAYVLGDQLERANRGLGNIRAQFEGIQRQITELDEPNARNASRRDCPPVASMTEEQQAAYVLALLSRPEELAAGPEVVPAGAATEEGATPEDELADTQDALEKMMLLYDNVQKRIDGLLRERGQLMRENTLLRNEIKRLQNRMPKERFTQDILK